MIGFNQLGTQPMIRFHALIPHLFSTQGHLHIYHLCFREAIKKLGFAYIGYTNSLCAISPLPEDWKRSFLWKNETQLSRKLLQVGRRSWDFSSIFKKKEPVETIRCFFLETLTFSDLLSLALPIQFFFRNDDFFWLLLRDDLRQCPEKEKYYRFLFKQIQKKLGNRFVLLTDSERVGTFYENLLGQKVHLVPIPHTKCPSEDRSQNLKETVLWWPGKPNQEKGAEKILLLAKQLQGEKVALCLSESAKPWLPVSPSIRFLKPILPREEYDRQLAQSHAVLLPYDPAIYHSRTSGIFVEAIFSGLFPFVTEGSWLAHELHKHHLPELILDWERPDLLKQILLLIKNREVGEKFEAMRAAYRSYHSLENYTQVIGGIANSLQIGCT